MESGTTNPRRTRNPRGQGDRLREEILLACTRLLDQSSSELTLSLRAIAREANVTAPSVSRHFRNLPEIIDMVVARQLQAFHDLLFEADSSARNPGDRILAIARTYITFGIQSPSRYRLLFCRTALPQWDDPGPPMAETTPVMTETFTLVVNTIQACIDSGIAQRTDATFSTFLLWYSLHGLVTLQQSITSFAWPDLDVAIDQILRGALDLAE